MAWAKRSRIRLLARSPDPALSHIDEAIGLAPHDASLRCWRGKCWASKGDGDKAIANFNEALGLDPQNVASLECRARAYLDRGEFDQVIADTTAGLKLNPGRLGLYLLRGDAWYKKESYDEAIDDDTTAIRLDPSYAYAYACRAEAWGRKRSRENQIADYTRAIELDPASALYRRLRATVWGLRGEHARAIADFDEAARLELKQPGDPCASWTQRDKTLHERVVENSENAIADFDRATKIDPAYGEPYYYRARIWKRKGAIARVVREYEALIERNPNHGLGHQGSPWTLSTSEDARVHNPRRAVEEANARLRADSLHTTPTAWIRSQPPTPMLG